MFGNSVYLPSYPSKSLCGDYSKICAPLISLAPAAAVNCSMKVGSAEFYPAGPQVRLTWKGVYERGTRTVY